MGKSEGEGSDWGLLSWCEYSSCFMYICYISDLQSFDFAYTLKNDCVGLLI